MKLKEYLTELKHLVDLYPELLNCDVVYSIDEEGNSYEETYFGPSVGYFKDDEFINVISFDEHGLTEKDVNAVCIN